MRHFNEQSFLLSPRKLTSTLNLLEYHFDDLFEERSLFDRNYSSKAEIILEQITLISQFHLLYSTMNHCKKYLEKMRFLLVLYLFIFLCFCFLSFMFCYLCVFLFSCFWAMFVFFLCFYFLVSMFFCVCVFFHGLRQSHR